jgi:hypothetical protein
MDAHSDCSCAQKSRNASLKQLTNPLATDPENPEQESDRRGDQY